MLKKMPFLFCFLPILLNAFWFDSISPKAQHAKDALRDIDSAVEKALIDFQIPGVAIGVVVDGHVVYQKGFGVRDTDTRLPVNEKTLFPIGSCTKAFTSFAIGNLVDSGLMYWDQPVVDVLPEFRLWDQYATSNTTIRDLLTHRTGMPRHDFFWYNSKMSPKEVLRKIRYLQPSHDIRERYLYNNLMYFVAGLAMERVEGKSWDKQISDRILRPLGMNETYFTLSDLLSSGNYSSPHIEKKEILRKIPFRDVSLIGAAGSMHSNVSDMNKWLLMQTEGGVHNQQALIGAATLKEMHAPQVIVPGAPEAKETILYSYGIGWTILSYRGIYLVSHDGISDGFTSLALILPGEKVGITILVNKNMASLPRYLSFYLIDRILDLPKHDWLTEGAEGVRKSRESLKQNQIQEDQQRKKGTSPTHSLQDYVGTYEHPGYGEISITLDNGNLHACYNEMKYVLGHWHYDIFSIVEEKQDTIVSLEGTKLTFSNNIYGDIGELSVPFEPKSDDIIFKRKADNTLTDDSYLRQFTGVYEIYGYTVEIVLRNHTLIAMIPGQPNYELLPCSENEFFVKSLTGSTVRFVLDSAKNVLEVLLIHPYGAFTATPKK